MRPGAPFFSPEIDLHFYPVRENFRVRTFVAQILRYRVERENYRLTKFRQGGNVECGNEG
jgi:hypothetical protein